MSPSTELFKDSLAIEDDESFNSVHNDLKLSWPNKSLNTKTVRALTLFRDEQFNGI